MTPNAGSKNILNFPAISTIFSAGDNSFQASPVISKIPIAGKNSMFTPENFTKKEPKRSKDPENLHKKKVEDLGTNLRMQKILQKKRPNKQSNTLKKPLNKLNKKPKELLQRPVKQLDRLFLNLNHSLKKRLKLSKKKSLMVKIT